MNLKEPNHPCDADYQHVIVEDAREWCDQCEDLVWNKACGHLEEDNDE